MREVLRERERERVRERRFLTEEDCQIERGRVKRVGGEGGKERIEHDTRLLSALVDWSEFANLLVINVAVE